MTAAGQKKRQRHNEKIKSLKRSKDSAVREALGLMATIPAEEHSDFVAAIELLKSKALRDAAIAEHDAAAAAEEMDVESSKDAFTSTVLLEELARAQHDASEAKVCSPREGALANQFECFDLLQHHNDLRMLLCCLIRSEHLCRRLFVIGINDDRSGLWGG